MGTSWENRKESHVDEMRYLDGTSWTNNITMILMIISIIYDAQIPWEYVQMRREVFFGIAWEHH